MPRVVASLLCLFSLARSERHTPSTCDVQLSKDQALLQVQSHKIKKVGAETKQCGDVMRRRRVATMGACRRRHHEPGHHDSDQPWDQWKCQGQQMVCQESAVNDATNSDGDLVGEKVTGQKKAAGRWCEVDVPAPEWKLKSCPSVGSTNVKVLSYNLFWWNLFKRHGGGHRSAGRLIARTSGPEQYDFMGFQECDDRQRILNDAGMAGDYEAIDGGRAIAMAYRKSRWTMLAHDVVDVGEDSRDQYYGKRSAMWGRFRNNEGKTVYFMNHHGPLKVSQGGGCTGSATAMNILHLIGQTAHANDVIILVGDFNAGPSSSRIQELEKHLNRVETGKSMGGVDHIFSNCGVGKSHGEGHILGKGDDYYKSDHDAVSYTFKI